MGTQARDYRARDPSSGPGGPPQRMFPGDRLFALLDVARPGLLALEIWWERLELVQLASRDRICCGQPVVLLGVRPGHCRSHECGGEPGEIEADDSCADQ